MSSSDVREFPSVIAPDKVINVGDEVMQQLTQPMEVAPTVEMKAVVEVKPLLTVKDIVVQLIERNVLAWKDLPQGVRDMMMAHPGEFEFIRQIPITATAVPDIKYNGVVMHWNVNISYWIIKEIVR